MDTTEILSGLWNTCVAMRFFNANAVILSDSYGSI